MKSKFKTAIYVFLRLFLISLCALLISCSDANHLARIEPVHGLDTQTQHGPYALLSRGNGYQTRDFLFVRSTSSGASEFVVSGNDVNASAHRRSNCSVDVSVGNLDIAIYYTASTSGGVHVDSVTTMNKSGALFDLNGDGSQDLFKPHPDNLDQVDKLLLNGCWVDATRCTSSLVEYVLTDGRSVRFDAKSGKWEYDSSNER